MVVVWQLSCCVFKQVGWQWSVVRGERCWGGGRDGRGVGSGDGDGGHCRIRVVYDVKSCLFDGLR